MPGILLVYYTRTGSTRRLAQDLAAHLQCDTEEIIDRKNRSGAAGYFVTLADRILRRPSHIQDSTKDPGKYDLVVIGGPVWMSSAAAPLRAYILRHRAHINEFAYFCSFGGWSPEKSLDEVETLLNKKAVSSLMVMRSEIAEPVGGSFPEETQRIRESYDQRVEQFAATLQSEARRLHSARH